MKRYNKILLLLILLIPLTLCSCKKKDTIMENYPSITDKKHVIVELSPKELIEKISNQESFIVTLGFEACPWCQALMPEYNEVAKSEGLKEVYYVDIKDMRDNVESSDRIYYLALYSYFNEIVDSIFTANGLAKYINDLGSYFAYTNDIVCAYRIHICTYISLWIHQIYNYLHNLPITYYI